MNLQETSEQQLLELARPSGLQRALRAIGCPGMLMLGYFLARTASAPVMQTNAMLGWLLAILVFVLATPMLLAIVASISSFSLRHARDELCKRLGQNNFDDAVSQIEQEIDELPSENRGWIALIRGQIVTAGQRVHIRLDLRNDEEAPTANIESIRGPKLNLFGPRRTDLEGWQRMSRELQPDEALELAELLDSLGPDSMANKSAGSKLWLDIALLRVGTQKTTSRCRIRINRPDQRDLDILTLVERGWLLSSWPTNAP